MVISSSVIAPLALYLKWHLRQCDERGVPSAPSCVLNRSQHLRTHAQEQTDDAKCRHAAQHLQRHNNTAKETIYCLSLTAYR